MPMSVEAMKQKGPLDVLMLSSDQIIGRRLKRPLSAGQAFLTTDLYLEGSGPQMDELLKPGFRAISIEVEAVRGGAVSPGQTVDVLFRSEPQKAGDRQTAIPEKTVVLLEGVEVLSVFRPEVSPLQAAVGYVSKNPLITLAVTPEQATRLQAVDGRGEISLAVRPPQEFVAMAGRSGGITLEEILGVTSPPPPAPAETSAPQRRRVGDLPQECTAGQRVHVAGRMDATGIRVRLRHALGGCQRVPFCFCECLAGCRLGTAPGRNYGHQRKRELSA